MPALLNGETREGPAELYERNKNGQLTMQAIDQGMNLSTFLEELDPTEDYGPEDRMLDAFGRQMRVSGIKTVNDPARGLWADEFGVFDKDGNRALAIEWASRRWREARFGVPANPHAAMQSQMEGRSVYTSSDEALNTIFRPYFDAAAERSSRLSAPLPLSRIVALQTGINGDAYRAAYMTEPAAADIRMVRVSELGEIPLATITAGAQTIRLHKYARGFEMSYEALRRTRINKVAFWIQRKAIQQENDKVEWALDVLINGDGNNNAATSYNLTTLDASTTANNVTLAGWLAFKNKFNPNYQMDVALTTEAVKLKLQLMNSGTANIPMVMLPQFGGFTELNFRLGDGVALGQTAAAPTGKVIGIDTSAALEHVMEIGATITETAKFVTRQSDVIVMSEVEGFAVLDKLATRILDTAA